MTVESKNQAERGEPRNGALFRVHNSRSIFVKHPFWLSSINSFQHFFLIILDAGCQAAKQCSHFVLVLSQVLVKPISTTSIRLHQSYVSFSTEFLFRLMRNHVYAISQYIFPIAIKSMPTNGMKKIAKRIKTSPWFGRVKVNVIGHEVHVQYLPYSPPPSRSKLLTKAKLVFIFIQG